MRDYPGIYRLAEAINERYQRLNILIGNAAVVGQRSPLDHIEPSDWDEVLAVNVTANWHLIRSMNALLRQSKAARVALVTSGSAWHARAYTGAYSVSKTALNVLGQLYAAETAATSVRVNLFNPGPTRTRMRAAVMPGEDPMTLPTPEDVARQTCRDMPAELHGDGQALRLPRRKVLNFIQPG